MKNFKSVELEQGTQDWLDWRSTVIGSSDAPVIMSESPWKSIEQLLNEKLGVARTFKGNAKTKLGQKLEPQARKVYSDLVGFELEPAVLQSNAYEWQAASLDGFSDLYSHVVEIKCGESESPLVF